jgi:hypothetical protein
VDKDKDKDKDIPFSSALHPSKSGLKHNHIVKHIVDKNRWEL